MRTVRERPRVVVAALVAVALLVAIPYWWRAGDNEEVTNAQQAEKAADSRADRAEAQRHQKARSRS